MDPRTLVPVLALHLVVMGGMLALIGARKGVASGLPVFGIGGIAFGLAYLLRMLPPAWQGWPIGLLADTAMVGAVVSYVVGVRRFVGRAHPAVPTLGALLLALLLVRALALALLGEVGRYIWLNAALGIGYAWLAIESGSGRSAERPEERLPLAVFAIGIGVLGAATLARAVAAAMVGTAPLFTGLWASLYYLYGAVVVVMLGPTLLWAVFVRLNQRLIEVASHDALTRVYNRNGLQAMLRRHFAGRAEVPAMTLLQVDIDHFKRFNDQHGHAIGDAVLVVVAQALSRQLRAHDFVARTGGEEFLVGCVGDEPRTAQLVAERLRHVVAELRVESPRAVDERLSCTVSIGVSRPFATLEDWMIALQQADTALYLAKQQGRNRVVVFIDDSVRGMGFESDPLAIAQT